MKQMQRSELVASDHPVTQKLLAELLRFNRDKIHRIFHEDLGRGRCEGIVFPTDWRTDIRSTE